MKKIVLIIFALIGFSANGFSQSAPNYTRTLTLTGTTPVNAGSILGQGLNYFRVSWTVNGGTLSGCQVKLSKSADNSTFADLIANQTCTSAGTSAITQDTTTWLQVTAGTYTGSGTLTLRIDAWIANPAGANPVVVTSITNPITVSAHNVTNAGTFLTQTTALQPTGATQILTNATSNTTSTAFNSTVYGQLLVYVNCATCSGGTTFNFFIKAANGTTYVPVLAEPIGSTTALFASSSQTAGVTSWRVQTNGSDSFEVTTTSYSAGTVNVWVIGQPSSSFPTTLNAILIGNLAGLAQDANLGATTDAAPSAGGAGSANAHLRGIDSRAGAMVTSLASIAAAAGSTFLRIADTAGNAISTVTDACDGLAKTTKTISFASTTAQVLLAAGGSGIFNHICYIHVNTQADEIVNVLDGTQTTNPCDTGTPVALEGSTTAANGVKVLAGGGWTGGAGIGTIYRNTAANRQLCIVTSGSSRTNVSISYVVQ